MPSARRVSKLASSLHKGMTLIYTGITVLLYECSNSNGELVYNLIDRSMETHAKHLMSAIYRTGSRPIMIMMMAMMTKNHHNHNHSHCRYAFHPKVEE